MAMIIFAIWKYDVITPFSDYRYNLRICVLTENNRF
jgi:hypothetical protein